VLVALLVSALVVLASIAWTTTNNVDRLERHVRDIQAELCVIRLVDDLTKPDMANAVRAMCDERHGR
jgi:hypothetical protein